MMTQGMDEEWLIGLLPEIGRKGLDEHAREIRERFDLLSRNVIERPLLTVALNTSGRIAGGVEVLNAVRQYLSDRAMDADVVETGSLGSSSEEPVLGIQLVGRTRVFFSRISAEDVPLILDDVFHQTIPAEKVLGQVRNDRHDPWIDVPFLDELPYFRYQERRIMGLNGQIDPVSIGEYIARGGYRSFLRVISYNTCEEVCSMVEESGLRGRSGSGYETGKKWWVAYQTPSEKKYLICNAEESDPGATMDRELMEGNPHQVIEGICIAAYAIGATKAYIYIRSEYEGAIEKLSRAIASARTFGILGENIMESGFNLSISIRKGPGAFVCGEETALIASMEGKRGMPQSKPPYPSEKGFRKYPTVVNNVETLSNVPHIVSLGPEGYRSLGTEESPGTKIFSVSGRSRTAGVVEVPMGTRLDVLVNEIIGGPREGRSLKAVHLGGPTGSMIPGDRMGIPLSFEHFREEGMVLGGGGLVLLDERSCIVDTVKYFMDFLKQQSCGKCIPCREGTKRMSVILNDITRKPEDDEKHDTLQRFRALMQLEKLADVMFDTSLCGLGKMASNPLISALKYFREEFEDHIFNRHCAANICRELRTYYIDVELCTGCTICAKRCPEEAIIGTEKHPYFIVPDKCTGCGICREVCKFSAVFYN
jgi:NADH:ubiquinone oxidoreductase subunit F (NADH-binding)